MSRSGRKKSPAREGRDDLATGDMVWIPGGTFRMGSYHHYPEEESV